MPGLPVTDNNAENEVLDDSIATVSMSLRRGLGPTIRKKGTTETRIALKAEEANLKETLLFPPQTAHDIGSTRSGSL